MISLTDVTESSAVSKSPIDPLYFIAAMAAESGLIQHVLKMRFEIRLTDGFDGDGTMGTESIIYQLICCEEFGDEQL